MFYVVFLVKLKKVVVIPKTWIKDHQTQWVKFVNYGINSGQKYLVYYTTKNESKNENGEPCEFFEANFNLSLNADSPVEGCYLAKILKYFGKYYIEVYLYFFFHLFYNIYSTLLQMISMVQWNMPINVVRLSQSHIIIIA